MNCEEYFELITGYADGELREAEVVLLTQHLTACAKCHQHLKEISALKNLLKQYAATKALVPSLGFSQKILQSVHKEIPVFGKKGLSWTSKYPLSVWATAAVLFLILLAGIFYFQQMGVQEPSKNTYYVEMKPKTQKNIYYVEAKLDSPPAHESGNTDFNNIDDYLYQHAMEGLRTPLTDNTVFVGYMNR
ncbi:MAG TPA: zf-HC2 domain-containing protein [Candidatus Limnocylindrales bacterium]|nr:zf-HC2 domain-containing protein [Candidatus Limnocylindrales bacterium]